jgi:hypothetical protein
LLVRPVQAEDGPIWSVILNLRVEFLLLKLIILNLVGTGTILELSPEHFTLNFIFGMVLEFSVILGQHRLLNLIVCWL